MVHNSVFMDLISLTIRELLLDNMKSEKTIQGPRGQSIVHPLPQNNLLNVFWRCIYTLKTCRQT
jgi:hypothetical protein